MRFTNTVVFSAFVLSFLPSVSMAQSARWNALEQPRTFRAQEQSVDLRRTDRRDPTGILRGQGVSSLYGGMGNMGGGSGRSANTGIGLGGIGASQGARN
ncbi:hypothetical protein MPOCJGCO_3375 [Methylobacterium trifolii]|uniref:Uncharacterized protein n=1 Tax=Methylobacterium trifolii TaxID=1003092 RepID=A0ABQ4U256_9HYPH|nr:hypothetical protein MPOCJGCO_3375 [Methylobacterium trifolii]